MDLLCYYDERERHNVDRAINDLFSAYEMLIANNCVTYISHTF